jgi:anti-sigma regulatory factor (Ser/Thr protein kinase)
VETRCTGDEVMVLVRDEGKGFDPDSLPDPTEPENLERAYGRGMLLIRTFMDEVRHNERGNEITMVKRRSHGEGSAD